MPEKCDPICYIPGFGDLVTKIIALEARQKKLEDELAVIRIKLYGIPPREAK
jgi:hypothetical protein